MIRSLLKFGYRRFGQRYNYDTSYMAQVADSSVSAGLRLSLMPLISQFRGPKKAQNVWAGAVIGSTMEGDCGPCVQLVVDMAAEAKVPADQIELCIEGNAEQADDVGLGFRFAQAAIADEPELDNLRNEIEDRFGAAALSAASFAAAGGRLYPVLKRGLGHGKACSKVVVQKKSVQVHK